MLQHTGCLSNFALNLPCRRYSMLSLYTPQLLLSTVCSAMLAPHDCLAYNAHLCETRICWERRRRKGLALSWIPSLPSDVPDASCRSESGAGVARACPEGLVDDAPAATYPQTCHCKPFCDMTDMVWHPRSRSLLLMAHMAPCMARIGITF